jgi:hypothetical protein
MANAAALLGTWRVTLWTRKAVATGEVTDAMGSILSGISLTTLTVA